MHKMRILPFIITIDVAVFMGFEYLMTLNPQRSVEPVSQNRYHQTGTGMPHPQYSFVSLDGRWVWVSVCGSDRAAAVHPLRPPALSRPLRGRPAASPFLLTSIRSECHRFHFIKWSSKTPTNQQYKQTNQSPHNICIFGRNFAKSFSLSCQ